MPVDYPKQSASTVSELNNGDGQLVPEELKPMSRNELIDAAVKEALDAVEDPYVFQSPIKHIAVIGAGPVGLVSTKTLLDRGLHVKTFERHQDLGGQWLYSDKVSSNPITCKTGVSPEAPLKNGTRWTPEVEKALVEVIPPSAIYRDLFTNLISPLMELRDFPWPKDTPLYLSHTKVHQYYRAYADQFGLDRHIMYNTSVEQVTKLTGSGWKLNLKRYERVDDTLRIHEWEETFDAVVMATGAHQQASIPEFKDLEAFTRLFPERVLHAKQYKLVDPFTRKNVLLVGGHVSACDLSKHLYCQAKKVYMSFRGPFQLKSRVFNLHRSTIPETTIFKPNIAHFSDKNGNINGAITFEDGTTVDDVDFIIFCTGYMYNPKPLASLVSDVPQPDKVWKSKTHVLNAYQLIFWIPDPTLAFVGAPPHLATTQFFNLQAETLARVWADKAKLPSQLSMQKYTDNRRPPCSPDDFEFHGEKQRQLGLIVWLNEHNRLLGHDEPELKEMGDHFEELLKDAARTWKEDSMAMLKAIRERKSLPSAKL